MLLHSSFCSLKPEAWLCEYFNVFQSDAGLLDRGLVFFYTLQVINYVLKVLASQRNDEFILDSFVRTAILDDTSAARRQYLKKVKM